MEQNQGERRSSSTASSVSTDENGLASPVSRSDGRRLELPDEHSWNWILDRSISSCCTEGHQLILEIVERLQENRWTNSDVFGVHLSLTEAVVNAIKHGNREDPAKKVYVACKVSPSRCWIEIRDEGAGFNPEKVPDCTLDENLDKPSGRGLRLMKNFMSHVEYHDCGKRLVMEKRLE